MSKRIVILVLVICFVFSVGCYDQFDAFVEEKIGIAEEKTEEKTTSETGKKQSTSQTSKEPVLHEPTERFNKVSFTDRGNWEWLEYRNGCYWESEKNNDGIEIAVRMYDGEGNELESYISEYVGLEYIKDKWAFSKLTITHYVQNTAKGYTSLEYSAYGVVRCYKEFQNKKMTLDLEFSYDDSTHVKCTGIKKSLFDSNGNPCGYTIYHGRSFTKDKIMIFGWEEYDANGKVKEKKSVGDDKAFYFQDGVLNESRDLTDRSISKDLEF